MNVSQTLNQLEVAQLVRPSNMASLSDALEYVFKHALVQETAYASLLRTSRTELHRRVAETIEALGGDHLEYDAAILAMHYARAGLHRKAFLFAMQAGDAARGRYATQEALMQYGVALESAAHLTSDDDVPARTIAAAYANRGSTLQGMGDALAAIDNYRAMIAFAERAGDSVIRVAGLNLLNRVRIVTHGSHSIALNDLDAALALANESGDALLTGNALWNFGLYYRFLDPLKGADYLQRAYDVAQQGAQTNDDLRSLAANAMLDSMIAMVISGRFKRALEYGGRAVAEYRALDNKHMLADALGGVALAKYFQGRVAEAREFGDEGVRISRAIDNPWGVIYNEWRLHEIELDRGNYAAVMAQFEQRRASARAVGFPVFIGIVAQQAARVFMDTDRPKHAIALCDESADAFASMRVPTWDVWGRAVRAWPRVRLDDLEFARPLLDGLWKPDEDADHSMQGFIVAGPVLAEWALAERRLAYGLRFCDWLLSCLEAEDVRRPAAEMRYWRAQLRWAAGNLDGARADAQQAREWLAACEAWVLLKKVDALWATMA